MNNNLPFRNTIPVVALTVDKRAAVLLQKPADFFETNLYYLDDEVAELATLTSAPLRAFSDEGGDIFYLGIQIKEDFYIAIDDTLLQKFNALKAQYSHPLIQQAQLAVVSKFC